MKRALSPATNPAGLMSAAGALYAAVVMILNVVHHRGVIDPKVIVAAVGAAAALYARLKVTPVADPRDGNGNALLRVADVAAAQAQQITVSVPPGGKAEFGRQVVESIREFERRSGRGWRGPEDPPSAGRRAKPTPPAQPPDAAGAAADPKLTEGS